MLEKPVTARAPGAQLARLTLLAAWLCGLTLWSCGGSSAGLRKAQRLLAAGDYPGAENAADAELARAPGQRAPWRIKIQAAMGRHDAAAAVAAYGELTRQSGSHDRKSLRAMAMATVWQGLHTPSARCGHHISVLILTSIIRSAPFLRRVQPFGYYFLHLGA